MRLLLVGCIFILLETGVWAGHQTTNAVISPHAFNALKVKAQAGDADAEFMLGKSYYEGVVVQQDKDEAVKWLEKAAEHGIVEAQMIVGVNYWNGVDVKMDEVRGVKWFRKAAEQGEPGAFHYLGAAYYLGKGVKQDYVESYKWTLVFKDSGRSVIPGDMASIISQLADLERKLTEKQIVEGKRLAKEAKARLSKMPRYSDSP